MKKHKSRMVAASLINAGNQHMKTYDFSLAREHYNAALGQCSLGSSNAADRQQVCRIQNNIGAACMRRGNIDEAIAAFGVAEIYAALEQKHIYASAAYMCGQYLPSVPDMRQGAAIWAANYAQEEVPRPRRHDTPKLRIGIMSSDLHFHAVSFYIAETLRYRSKRAKWYAYSTHRVADPMTQQLRSQCFDEWRDVAAMSSRALAQLIRDDKIDVLLDMNGHTLHHRLLVVAERPAALQLEFGGFPSTTGLSAIDYKLTDERLDPPGNEQYYIERLLRLPKLLCYGTGTKEVIPHVLVPPCHQRGHIVFGAFAFSAKLNDPLFAMWAQILTRIPDAELLIKSQCGDDMQRKAEIRQGFVDLGVAPQRIRIVGHTTYGEHLAMHNECDIMLDPWPYNNHIMLCDGLMMGVPTVSLCGKYAHQRAGASILPLVGLGDLVADTPAAYIDAAVELAGDDGRLARRDRIRDLYNDTMDHSSWMRSFEDALFEVYETGVDKE